MNLNLGFYAIVCLAIALAMGVLRFTTLGAGFVVVGISKVLCYVFIILATSAMLWQRYVPAD